MKNKFLNVKSALVLFAEYSWRIALLLNGTSLYFSIISLKSSCLIFLFHLSTLFP